MKPLFPENHPALNDLPPELQEVLRRYDASRSDEDLNAVLFAVLVDLGAEVERESITDATDFMQDLGLESLVLAEFVFFFEDVFDVEITNESLSKMQSLGELKSFLKTQIA